MYSFQANAGKRKNRQTRRLLYIIIFVLVVALVGVSFAYYRSTRVNSITSDALIARAMSEAAAAQNAVYRLTQSSGTNTTLLLASVRCHVYAMQSLNTLTANIYGPGTVLADADLLAAWTNATPASRPEASSPRRPARCATTSMRWWPASICCSSNSGLRKGLSGCAYPDSPLLRFFAAEKAV